MEEHFDRLWKILMENQNLDQLARALRDLMPAGQSHRELLRKAYQNPRKVGDFIKLWVYLMVVDPLAIAVGMHLMGRAFNNDNRPDEAIGPLRMALRAYAYADEPDGLARVQTSLANALYFQSHYDEALELLMPALQYFSRDDQNIFATNTALTNIIDIYLDLGHTNDALTFIDQMRQLSEDALERARHDPNPDAIDAMVDHLLTLISAEMKASWAAEEGRADLNFAKDKLDRAEKLLDDLSKLLDSDPELSTYYEKDFLERMFRFWLNRAILNLRFCDHNKATRSLTQAADILSKLDSTEAGEDWIDLHSFRMYQAILQGNVAGAGDYLRKVWPQLRDMDNVRSPREVLQRLQVLSFIALLPEVATETKLFQDAHVHALTSNNAQENALSETIDGHYPNVVALSTSGFLQGTDRQDQRLLAYELLQTSMKLEQLINRGTGTRSKYMIRAVTQSQLEAIRLAFAAGRGDLADAIMNHITQSETPLSQWQQLTIHALVLLHNVDTPLEALALMVDTLKEKHDYPMAVQIQKALGQRYEEQIGDDEQAYHAYVKATELLESWRGGAYQNSQLLIEHRIVYERPFAWMAERGNIVSSWHWSERLRAQMQIEELLVGQLLSDKVAVETPRLKELRQELRYVQAILPPPGRITRSVADSPQTAMIDHYRQLTQEYLRLYKELHDPQLDSTTPPLNAPISIAELEALLPADTALISFQWVAQNADEALARAGLWAFVVQSGFKPVVLQVLDSFSLDEVLKIWQTYSMHLENSSEQLQHEFFQSALGTIIGKPVGMLGQHIKNLIFVLDEGIPLLPLHLARHMFEPSRYEYLFERYVISYAPSATLLTHYQARHDQRTTHRSWFPLIAGWPSKVNRLETVQTELADVCSHLDLAPVTPNELPYRMLLDLLPKASLAHLSCHGSFPRQSSPLFARLHLEDEFLYAHDFYGLGLQCDLLVLSACDVGQHGRGLQGMVSAALNNGASAVMAAMWPVPDFVIPEIMNVFYSALKHGRSVGSALHTMQRRMLDAGEPISRWGGFFITGLPWIRGIHP